MATLMAEKFEKAGMRREDYEFGAHVMEYGKKGGTLERALEIVRDAFARMPGKGQCAIADGQSRDARTRQPVEDVRGQASFAADGLPPNASPSSSNHDERGQLKGAVSGPLADSPSRRVPDRGGDGHTWNADGQGRPAITVREPTQQQRLISARNARVVAITIMDTFKIDGRPIGDWTVAEARRAGHLKTREGHILIAASRMVANAAGDELLRSVVKPAEMQKIVQKAAEVADAV